MVASLRWTTPQPDSLRWGWRAREKHDRHLLRSEKKRPRFIILPTWRAANTEYISCFYCESFVSATVRLWKMRCWAWCVWSEWSNCFLYVHTQHLQPFWSQFPHMCVRKLHFSCFRFWSVTAGKIGPLLHRVRKAVGSIGDPHYFT